MRYVAWASTWRNRDLNNWTTLTTTGTGGAGYVLTNRGTYDPNKWEDMVWAHVYVEDTTNPATYYMFYTGVDIPSSGQWCQRIMVAKTTTPDVPSSWVRATSNTVQRGRADAELVPSQPHKLVLGQHCLGGLP